jgi:hypothetical protein
MADMPQELGFPGFPMEAVMRYLNSDIVARPLPVLVSRLDVDLARRASALCR